MPSSERRAPAPVYDGDFPDPFVLVVRGGGAGARYFAYGTQAGKTNVQVMESADLRQWDHRGEALPELPPWAAWGRTWAPSVLERDGTYVLYYVTHVEAAGRQGISVATSSDPAGPFIDRSEGPFIFQEERGGSIDPSPFVDGDGTAYLLWKSDDNAIGGKASLWGVPLAPDGRAQTRDPVELLSYDCGWEDPLIEAPSLARLGGGRYVLFYSGNWWESDGYGVGYATGSGPLGPFRKATADGPWLVSAPGMAGPGGAEVFVDAAGDWRLAFHAWTPPRVGYEQGGARSLWVERLSFDDGRPQLVPEG